MTHLAAHYITRTHRGLNCYHGTRPAGATCRTTYQSVAEPVAVSAEMLIATHVRSGVGGRPAAAHLNEKVSLFTEDNTKVTERGEYTNGSGFRNRKRMICILISLSRRPGGDK
ncbi:unnamed protein product [Gadus morhua 'NCC']